VGLERWRGSCSRSPAGRNSGFYRVNGGAGGGRCSRRPAYPASNATSYFQVQVVSSAAPLLARMPRLASSANETRYGWRAAGGARGGGEEEREVIFEGTFLPTGIYSPRSGMPELLFPRLWLHVPTPTRFVPSNIYSLPLLSTRAIRQTDRERERERERE
jgi:hypothetical protein